MALKLYYKDEDDIFQEVSVGNLSSPVETIHDGKTGDVQTKQLFVKNDDSTLWYSNIVISPIDLVDPNPYGDIIYTETGWGVKLSSGEDEPSESEWDDIRWGEEIVIEDIGSDSSGDSVYYYPFWYLITCPPNTNAKVKTDIVLNVAYTENVVIV